MFVVTIDQRRSRARPDAVPQLLDQLNRRPGLALPFERTAGDEVQGVVEAPSAGTDLVLELLRGSGWWIGIGLGELEQPLPQTARAGRGPAYVAAREAVEAAKGTVAGIAVRGVDGAEHVQAALALVAALLRRRSSAGWEVVELVVEGRRQSDVAELLGVTRQAVSGRLRVAGWAEEQEGRALVSWLLDTVSGSSNARPPT